MRFIPLSIPPYPLYDNTREILTLGDLPNLLGESGVELFLQESSDGHTLASNSQSPEIYQLLTQVISPVLGEPPKRHSLGNYQFLYGLSRLVNVNWIQEQITYLYPNYSSQQVLAVFLDKRPFLQDLVLENQDCFSLRPDKIKEIFSTEKLTLEKTQLCRDIIHFSIHKRLFPQEKPIACPHQLKHQHLYRYFEYIPRTLETSLPEDTKEPSHSPQEFLDLCKIRCKWLWLNTNTIVPVVFNRVGNLDGLLRDDSSPDLTNISQVARVGFDILRLPEGLQIRYVSFWEANNCVVVHHDPLSTEIQSSSPIDYPESSDPNLNKRDFYAVIPIAVCGVKFYSAQEKKFIVVPPNDTKLNTAEFILTHQPYLPSPQHSGNSYLGPSRLQIQQAIRNSELTLRKSFQEIHTLPSIPYYQHLQQLAQVIMDIKSPMRPVRHLDFTPVEELYTREKLCNTLLSRYSKSQLTYLAKTQVQTDLGRLGCGQIRYQIATAIGEKEQRMAQKLSSKIRASTTQHTQATDTCRDYLIVVKANLQAFCFHRRILDWSYQHRVVVNQTPPVEPDETPYYYPLPLQHGQRIYLSEEDYQQTRRSVQSKKMCRHKGLGISLPYLYLGDGKVVQVGPAAGETKSVCPIILARHRHIPIYEW